MTKLVFFILISYCIITTTNAQFCNSKSGKCYQQNAYFADSEIYMHDYKYSTVHNIYKSATASVDLYMTIFSPCALPLNIDSAKNFISCKSCKRPFILLIHGGGFRSGCKTGLYDECIEFAKRGYVAASIDYRLGWVAGDEKQKSCNKNFCFATQCATPRDDSCKPEYKDSMDFAQYRALQDAAAAMRFIAHYADSLNIDRNYLYIGGHSAGSIIAASLCYLNQIDLNYIMPRAVLGLGSLNRFGNLYNDTFKIAGLFNNWGCTADTSYIKGDRDKIPMIAFHGIDDSVVPFGKGIPLSCPSGTYNYCYGSSVIAKRLMHIYPDLPVELYCCYGGHGIFNAIPSQDAKSMWRVEKAICFFNRVRNGDKTQTWVQINQNDDSISYQKLDSISPVNCSLTRKIVPDTVFTNYQSKTPIEIYVFPNPTSSNATLIIKDAVSSASISITDLTGKILWIKNIINENTVDLPLKNFAPGLYLICLRTRNYSSVIKLIKSNK